MQPHRPPAVGLLIDDEELVRTATAEMIRDLGHRGRRSERRRRKHWRGFDGGLAVDVVITDYMMPGMDGGALARRVAKTFRACRFC